MLMLCLLTACTPLQALANSTSEVDRKVASTVQLSNPITGGAWTGVVIDQTVGTYGYPTTVLTIIHDSPETRFFVALGVWSAVGKIGVDGEPHSYRVAKWDPCSEVALLSTVLDEPTEVSDLAWWRSRVGQKVSTVGNPLGNGLQFNRGYISAEKALPYDCTFNEKPVVLDGYAGGTVPGQTGSPLFNSSGRITGLLTAVSVYTSPTFDQYGQLVGITPVPVYHMGYYVPLKVIREVIAKAPWF